MKLNKLVLVLLALIVIVVISIIVYPVINKSILINKLMNEDLTYEERYETSYIIVKELTPLSDKEVLRISELLQSVDTDEKDLALSVLRFSHNKLAPGIYSHDTLLYGVEVKFYSHRLSLTSTLETEVRNLFAIGDGAGVSRGLIQASASGVIAARQILKRCEHLH